MTGVTDPRPAGGALDATAVRAVLAAGELTVRGRVMPASNATYLTDAELDGSVVACVYKPVSGERPLWDFPDGTLAGREVAAHLVSEALGWRVVPLTVLRDGPAGPGMVQQWQEPSSEVEAVDLVPHGRVPEGYRHVLDAYDAQDRPISLVHEDSPALLRMAVFDVVVNNADRKGGHVLAMADGHRYGVDHGICFHVEDKLRTVLWGWAEEEVPAAEVDDLRRLRARLADERDPLVEALSGLVTRREIHAVAQRVERLLRSCTMPVPDRSWPSIPWPAF